MNEAKTILHQLGEQQVMAVLGVKAGALFAAKHSNRFPAAWYLALRDLGAAQNVVVPLHLFSWKLPRSGGVDRAQEAAPGGGGGAAASAAASGAVLPLADDTATAA
ncbi:hypothetical protein [Polycladidibacter hongkongensis]|uniref:hypothetical protein n=1 Tax=Polycladidibacter hongkongensis TaxID=1647556 RepID=UPI00082AAA43|nr:hypothetical protein [Pseudovibrio hongkongensis]